MPSAESIVEWYRGSGLRTFLAKLDETQQQEFLTDVLDAVRAVFPPDLTAGEFILEFPRLFWLATKG